MKTKPNFSGLTEEELINQPLGTAQWISRQLVENFAGKLNPYFKKWFGNKWKVVYSCPSWESEQINHIEVETPAGVQIFEVKVSPLRTVDQLEKSLYCNEGEYTDTHRPYYFHRNEN